MGAPTPSIQFAWDGPGSLGAGQDGYALCWDNAAGRFGLVAKAATAHTHAPSDLSSGGASSGQALVWNGSAWAPGSAGVTDHGALSGLADDDHGQYVLLAPAGSARNVIQPTGAAVKPLIIKAAAGQTANLLEFQNSSGTALAYVSPAGSLNAPSGSVSGVTALRSATAATTAVIAFVDGSGGWGQLGRTDGSAFLEWGSGIGGLGLKLGRGVNIISVSASSNAVQIETPYSTQSAAQMYIKTGASQTGNALETRSSTNAVQFALGPSGQIRTNQTAANTNTPSGATARQLPLYSEAGTLLGYVPVYGAAW